MAVKWEDAPVTAMEAKATAKPIRRYHASADDRECFTACLAELSPEAQADIKAYCRELVKIVHDQHEAHKLALCEATGEPPKKTVANFGELTAGELVMACIRQGLLPLRDPDAQKILAKNMKRWGR